MVVLEVHQMAFLEFHWFLGFSPGLGSRQMHMGHKYPVMSGVSPANWVAEQIVRCATRDQFITLCIEPR